MTQISSQLDRIIKAYDIRGLVDADVTEPVAFYLGAATADVLGTTHRFVVGRDMRPSSPSLARAFIDGLTSRQAEVIDIGLASTDQLYFASGVLNAAGAMFTASHNPAEYNGIKLCRPGAAPIAIDTGLHAIGDRARQLAALPLPATPDDSLVARRSFDAEFAEHVQRFVDLDPSDPIVVAVDAGNGMGGHIWPLVAADLPIDTRPLYFELDGSFPHHPADPLNPDNLRDLQAHVVEHHAAIGLAFDGDADRVFAVDEHGDIVNASVVGAIVADRMLAKHPGATVLYNLICSRIVPETIVRAGGQAGRTRVGHSFIKATMADTDAIMAIEHSGHYYFRDNYRADSGVIAALLLIEALTRSGRPLSELTADYNRYVQSGEHNFRVVDQAAALQRVVASYADHGSVDHEDGVTVDLGDRWFNVRPSNTEPLLRVNVEAPDRRILDDLLRDVTALLT
ncbi:MAG: hypothetical protein WD576_03130 [Nitriliruptoraceae bacterium]